MGLDRDAFIDLGRHPDQNHGSFHMTAAAFRLARHVNGVAKLHRDVTRELWSGLWPGRDAEDVPVEGITNGVHVGSWMSHHLMILLDEVYGPFWEREPPDGDAWERILELDDERLWETHGMLKRTLLDFCREQARERWRTFWKDTIHLVGAGTLLGPEPLTIGFARRFATYKRANLLFRDEDRLRRLLTDPHRPVQLIFSGKAHPADDGAKAMLQRVWHASREAQFEGRIAFVEDYDVHVAHRLVQGVDLWLNLPRVPLEACGTSGMKAALNFVPQLSTLDGWWAEGFNGDNGWAIPKAEAEGDELDAIDHESLFTLLEREVVPTYYTRDERGLPSAWIAMMKQAAIVGAKTFTTRRMVQDYTQRFYVPALQGVTEDDDPPTDAIVIGGGSHAPSRGMRE
jgi:starch phosphorylase